MTHWTKTEVESLPWEEFWHCYQEAGQLYKDMNGGKHGPSL